MNDCSFWADFFDTFQSSPDWIKALWIITAPAFVLGLVALLLLQLRTDPKRRTDEPDKIICSIRRCPNGELVLIEHARAGANPPTREEMR